MLVFVVRRLLSVVAVMVGVAALVFSVFYAFRPERVSDGTGYFHQLVHYLDRVFLHFDLGTSYERGLGFQPIAPLLRASFPADLSLVAGGLVVGAAAGVALGAVAQQRRGTLVARGLDGFAAFGHVRAGLLGRGDDRRLLPPARSARSRACRSASPTPTSR